MMTEAQTLKKFILNFDTDEEIVTYVGTVAPDFWMGQPCFVAQVVKFTAEQTSVIRSVNYSARTYGEEAEALALADHAASLKNYRTMLSDRFPEFSDLTIIK